MKTLDLIYNSRIKFKVKLNTKMDDFYESAIKVGNNDWVVLKRNLSEGGVNINFLDKYTPSTHELAHFDNGKFNFSNYMNQIKFIALFKKYPRLKRELLKVSYPIESFTNVNIDFERFKRSMKYYKYRLFRSFKYNFAIKLSFIYFLLIFLGINNSYSQSYSISQQRYNDSISFNTLPVTIIDFDGKAKGFNQLPEYQQTIFKQNIIPYKPLDPKILEKIKFKNKRTLVFFYSSLCGASKNVEKIINSIKKTSELDIIKINIDEHPDYKTFIKTEYVPVIWFIKSSGYYRQQIGESDITYQKIDAFVKKKYKFL